jgi:hypothetical protein
MSTNEVGRYSTRRSPRHNANWRTDFQRHCAMLADAMYRQGGNALNEFSPIVSAGIFRCARDGVWASDRFGTKSNGPA